jgi:hypothetical protein
MEMVPDKSSIARARARLGPAPLQELFAQVARPLATQATKRTFTKLWLGGCAAEPDGTQMSW